MSELIATLVPLLLVDVLNPVLFAVLIFATGSKRPVANSSALLLGHTLAYLCVGIGAAYAVDWIAHRLANPQPVDFVIEFVVGLACLYAVIPSRGGGASESRNPSSELTPLGAMLYGAIVNFIGAPFALPYFAAISQILDAGLSADAALLTLIAYNLLYALAFASVPALVWVMGKRARPLLEKINGLMTKGADFLMPWLMLLLGLLLLADASVFFITGKPL